LIGKNKLVGLAIAFVGVITNKYLWLKGACHCWRYCFAFVGVITNKASRHSLQLKINYEAKSILILSFILVATTAMRAVAKAQVNDSLFISYTVDVKKQDIQLYWKNDKNENFKSIQNLKQWLEQHKRKLVFAMNAGMYKPDNSPAGLFIQKQKSYQV